MNNDPKVDKAQRRVNEIQKLYREWVELVPTLEQADKAWARAIEIMRQIEKFYFHGEYNQVHQLMDSGVDLDLRTPGEYSVMGEDTIWNATGEMQSMAWLRLRSAIAYLDQRPDENTDNEPDEREQP